jgi:hypothetical protein
MFFPWLWTRILTAHTSFLIGPNRLIAALRCERPFRVDIVAKVENQTTPKISRNQIF